ncbi:calmodulin-regulated spectrin-associated protein 1 isoform X4 [Protopterus annectens]|uniref:calmodulin-regulated spectrin-associated protein 1 isoform X4 n=1 Tax=Protopterus annectens TaxID=7888 RepID=UPI001CFAC712|nr:calmodulin-regulated spectrin-associated protein 1 isoform X4 [Protopterus annectens]
MVDVDVGVGGDSTKRKMDSVADNAAEFVPLELYDSARAKIAANLQWICAKAYGIDHIPEELKDPFYVDQYEQEHIKPPVIKLLVSSELYCRVCSLIQKGDQVALLQGHQQVIQALSRKGIYAMESDDTPVSESDLSCTTIKMSAHMAMIDALMMAYTVEMISIEKVVSSVKRFSTFSASKELPYDLEDAMVFWINKVNLKMREITEKELKMKQQLLESPSHQKSPSKWYWKLVPVRYRRDHPLSKQLPYFPVLEDLMKDVCDGSALLAVVHYYCPELIKLDDICLKEVTSIGDHLYNIQLLKDFSNEYLNKCFYLTLEDMLYAPLVLKPNVMVFIAELFWWFEIVKPEFVQPRDIQEVKDAKSILQQKSSRPPIPISNATKRSFMVSPATATSGDLQMPIQSTSDVYNRYYLHPEESESLGKGSPAFSPSHPLLPLRQKQQKALQGEDSSGPRHRSNSLTRVDGQPRGSVIAWPEKKPRPLSQPTPYAVHSATDSDLDVVSGDSISLARSISKDSLASNIVNGTPKHQTHVTTPVKPNGKGLLGNVDIDYEEEDEELIAITKSDDVFSPVTNCNDLDLQSVTSGTVSQNTSARSEFRQESFYLEPLLPAILKPAKEKHIIVNKQEECGEEKPKLILGRRQGDGHLRFSRRKGNNHVEPDVNRTFTPISSSEFTTVTDTSISSSVLLPVETDLDTFQPLTTSSIDHSSVEQSGGFFLHSTTAEDKDVGKSVELIYGNGSGMNDSDATWTIRQDSDSEILDIEEAERDLIDECCPINRKYFEEEESAKSRKYFEEEESAKLQEDMKVKEHEDKEDASGRSSPCLSTVSQASSISLASGSVRMTSFAERKLQRINSHEAKSSTSSSQKTTPDGSECYPPPMITWKQKREQSPNRQNKDNAQLLASELVQLHMQLEEKRRAIETQKKKMEALSARQRLKLGKAAFLHVVKKGKSESISQPLKPEYLDKDSPKTPSGDVIYTAHSEYRTEEDEVILNRPQEKMKEGREVRIQEKIVSAAEQCLREPTSSPTIQELEKNINAVTSLEEGNEINECDISIEKLNETISTLQQAIMKISQQQEMLMSAPAMPSPSSKCEQKFKPAIQFVEPLSPNGTSSARKPSRFAHGRGSRVVRPSELKVTKDKQLTSPRITTPSPLPCTKPFQANRTPSAEADSVYSENNADVRKTQDITSTEGFRLVNESNQRTFILPSSKDTNGVVSELPSNEPVFSLKQSEVNYTDPSGKENIPVDGPLRNKIIEVDISELNASEDEHEIDNRATEVLSEGDQKAGLGFFFKDEEKAEDELAKRRAAFLLKQQRKAEEARLRKQQLEAEQEQKRDEARRKAEEERIRKEEEKARRELIKQEYLRRKQQQMLEEQGLAKPKPKPKPKPKKQRPDVHREESYCETPVKCSSTPDNLSSAQSGSSLSLASAATTEAESVNSDGASSQRLTIFSTPTNAKRVEYVDSFQLGSRNPSRNTERDWENASTASSVASVADVTGLKLYKEPSSKSNKSIIHNAISHCCLAGKVNEPQKKSILEELEKSEANHYIILFRDAGCQFRALYSYIPDTEEICKLTGTGPRNITKKMIDKLYKYSSDRKQFSLIPAKTLSVSVDALTIHNHLWQVKRPAVPKKTTAQK